MNKYYRLILAAVLTGFTSTGVAETLGYTYLSVEYSKFSSGIDKFSQDLNGNGLSVDLSYAVRPHIAVVAGYSAGSAEVSSSGAGAGAAAAVVDADIDSLSLGFIAHAPINDTADFILGASFINGKIDVKNTCSCNKDSDGGTTTIGVRAMSSDNLELNGFIIRSKIEEISRISVNLGAAYYVSESISIDLAYSLDSNGDLFALGVTKYF